MEFEQQVTVSVSPDQVWNFLWDVERVAACIPGCKDARVVEAHRRYEAIVGERIGPFKVQFPLAIEVVEVQAPRRLAAVASGRDASVGSSMKMRLDLEIDDGAPGQTVLRFRTDLTILGKLAALGYGMIKRKADDVMAQFAENLRRALEEGHRDAAAI